MDYANESLKRHYDWGGKIEIASRVPLENRDDLAFAYTPGVAQPCLEIQKDVGESYRLTRRSNLIAVVTDGTAVLGLGDIGPEAAMPVMEGKCALFKAFGGVDAVPICVRSKRVKDIVETVRLIAGSFGGINLEDISAPRCFEVEKRLKARCDIPIFHDDQHGTAIVVLAALTNALKLARKRLEDARVVVSGAGAAGIATVRLLVSLGLEDAVLCDSHGAIYEGRGGLSYEKAEMARATNRRMAKGGLADALVGADAFIGLSVPGCVSQDMLSRMGKDAIVFALANPVPEILPDLAKEAGVAIVGTGRSDYANQINNALAFPGVFRGALDVRASDVNDEMKVAAARAIASYVPDGSLAPDFIVPDVMDRGVAAAVGDAVARAARDSGVARLQ